MTFRDQVKNDYFEWMYDLVTDNRCSEEVSYRRLLMHLHNTEFVYINPMDENRAKNGEHLRYRFARQVGVDEELLDIGPCSIMEMILALAIRCEEETMDDPDVGDRTAQWFWNMVTNLGLGGVMDDQYDRRYVDDVLDRFLNREYEPDGRGGLFRIRNCKYDLREVEIWCQMCWYLNSIV